MLDFRDIFSVSRAEYKEFLNQLKGDARRVEEIEITNYSKAVKVFSQKTGKCLCSRVSYMARTNDEEPKPEKYYIFEMPDDDERLAAIPKMKVVLETKEEVQAFLDGMKKMKEQEA